MRADLVFIVPVLELNRASIAVEAWRGGIDIDDVGRDVAAARLQLVDLPGIRAEQLFRCALARVTCLWIQSLVLRYRATPEKP